MHPQTEDHIGFSKSTSCQLARNLHDAYEPQNTENPNRMKPRPYNTLPCRGSLAAAILQVVLLTAAAPGHASSIITWGPATNISGDSDVSTAGTLVGAFKLGAPGVGNASVNGVTFNGLAVGGNSVTSGNFNLATASSFGASNTVFATGPFGLSAAYEALISSSVYTFGVPFVLTMSSLVAGATYQIEWWSSDNLGSGTNTTATAGNSVSLATTAGQYGSARWLPGQFTIGTFVADATTSQTVTFSTGYFAQINSFQLRQASPVPDTGETFALFGVALLGLAAFGRMATSVRKV